MTTSRREENEAGISRAPQRPPARPGGGLPGDRIYTPGSRRIQFIGAFGDPSEGLQEIQEVKIQGPEVLQLDNWAWKIMPGTEFEVVVTYLSGSSGIIQRWTSCVTVKGPGIANYQSTLVYWGNQADFAFNGVTVKLNKLGKNIMPDQDLALRLKIWMNDNDSPSPIYPPETEW